MLKEKYEKWTKEFMESWKELDWKRTLETLDKNVEYYENPIDKPCQKFEEVTNLWNIVADNQKDISYEFEIISYNGEFLGINLPAKVALKVTKTEPGVKGDTATRAMKDATLETGLVIKVPLFVEQDEEVYVRTDTGAYDSRA